MSWHVYPGEPHRELVAVGQHAWIQRRGRNSLAQGTWRPDLRGAGWVIMGSLRVVRLYVLRPEAVIPTASVQGVLEGVLLWQGMPEAVSALSDVVG